MRKLLTVLALAAAVLLPAAAASASTMPPVTAPASVTVGMFAGFVVTPFEVTAHDVHVHVGETLKVAGRTETVTGVENYPGGVTVFQLSPWLPKADLHRVVPFTVTS